MKAIAQRRSFDCGIACIAMFCHVDYDDALYVAQKVAGKKLYTGLTLQQVIKIAAHFQRPLRMVHWRKVDLEEDSGILSICYPKSKDGHAVVLRRGTIIEPDPTSPRVWDADIYLSRSKGRQGALLAEAE